MATPSKANNAAKKSTPRQAAVAKLTEPVVAPVPLAEEAPKQRDDRFVPYVAPDQTAAKVASGTIPPAPSWLSEPSVQTFLLTIVALAVGVVTLLHPGFHEPLVVNALIPSLSTVIAGVANIVNIIFKHKAKLAALK